MNYGGSIEWTSVEVIHDVILCDADLRAVENILHKFSLRQEVFSR